MYLPGEKSNQQRIETIWHIVLKFQFSHACLQKGEASTNVMLVAMKFLRDCSYKLMLSCVTASPSRSCESLKLFCKVEMHLRKPY